MGRQTMVKRPLANTRSPRDNRGYSMLCNQWMLDWGMGTNAAEWWTIWY